MSTASLPATADLTPGPHHVAIIMDGNGRWAKARALPRVAGHRRGADAVRRVVRGAGDPSSWASALRREVTAVRSDVAVSRVAPLSSFARDMVAASCAGRASSAFRC